MIQEGANNEILVQFSKYIVLTKLRNMFVLSKYKELAVK